MGEGAWLVAFLGAQRLVELGLAQFNTGRLRAEGELPVQFIWQPTPSLDEAHYLAILGICQYCIR